MKMFRAAQDCAVQRGIFIADARMEIWINGRTFYLIDELLTLVLYRFRPKDESMSDDPQQVLTCDTKGITFSCHTGQYCIGGGIAQRGYSDGATGISGIS